MHGLRRSVQCLAALVSLSACDVAPVASAVIENGYPSTDPTGLVIYRARFQSASFEAPILPGSSSESRSTVPTSGARSFVLVAPGWDPQSDRAPTSFVVLESNLTFRVEAGSEVRIRVDDSSFQGNCSAGKALSQDEADIVIQAFFRDVFVGLKYDAATCTSSTEPTSG